MLGEVERRRKSATETSSSSLTEKEEYANSLSVVCCVVLTSNWPQEPPPQTSPPAAAARVPKSLPAPAVPSATSSLASSSVRPSRRRVGVAHWRRVRQLGCDPLLRTRTALVCASARMPPPRRRRPLQRARSLVPSASSL